MFWALAHPDRQALHETGFPSSITFSPDLSTYAIGEQSDVKLWVMATGNQLRSFKEIGMLGATAFSPDGKLLASDSADFSIILWDISQSRVLHRLHGHTASLESLAFSPDGRMLASAGNDRTARLWDIATGNLLATLRGHTDQVLFVAFSPDGAKLATASPDEMVKVWDASTGKELMTLKEHPAKRDSIPPAAPMRVAFSPDGSRFWRRGHSRTSPSGMLQQGEYFQS